MPFSAHFTRVRFVSARPSAFTLTEILVVVGIILLLSALLFPVFKGIQERSRQTTCAANMQQIYLAVRLYKDDEREYPASLAALMPDTSFLLNTNSGTVSATNDEGTGYFRKSKETLLCPNDDTEAPADAVQQGRDARSSYGDLSTNIQNKAPHETIVGVANFAAIARENLLKPDNSPDWGRVAWNYWGYDDQGIAFRSPQEAIAALGALPVADAKKLLRNSKLRLSADYEVPADVTINTSDLYYNARGWVRVIPDSGPATGPFDEDPREANPLLHSLSNRFAPESTIITHCVFHRLSTGADLIGPHPGPLYAAPDKGKGARDIVLRVDGSAKSHDISLWQTPPDGRTSFWQLNDF